MWQDTRSTLKQSIIFLYRNDKGAANEIRETSPFIVATNNIKYLGETLTEEMKDLYKNFKSLKKMKKIPENKKISLALG